MSEPTIAEVAEAVRAAIRGAAGARPSADVFAGRLLGLEAAEGSVRDGRELVLMPGTVVTPLARDFLKRAGVATRWANEAEEVRAGGEWGFVIEHESGTAAAVRRSLLEGRASWREAGRTTREAVSWLLASPGRGAAVLTGEASVASWRANSTPGVRAALATDPDSVSRAIGTLGVNLLVVEPRGLSIFQVRQLLATFRRGGPPGLPVELEVAREDRRDHRPRDPLPKAPGPAERALRDRLAHAAVGARGGLLRPG